MQKTQIITQEVAIKAKKDSSTGELADIIYYECSFCGKRHGYQDTRKICEKLSGADAFYCVFCLRNGFNMRSNKNILIVSFRSIIGYLYYEHYLFGEKMYISQINDLIETHARAGLKNPLFRYDYEDFLWFIDFNRIGKGKKRLKLSDISKTIAEITSSFNLPLHVPSLNLAKYQEKYEEAISKFYQSRFRPDDKKALIPTFANCGIWDAAKKFSFEDTRCFTGEDLVAK